MSSDGIPQEHHMQHTGGWLPRDHRVQRQWFEDVVAHVDQNPKDYHPVIKDFKALIEGDTSLYMLCNAMFSEIPSKKPYKADPAGHRQVRDYEHMLQLLNHLMTLAPHWSDKEHGVGLVGLPIQALYEWPMGTAAGYAFFLSPKVNAMLKKVLNVWGEFLRSSESAKCLSSNSDGWFGATGVKDLTTVANEAVGSDDKFEDLFICDPSMQYYGYTSWDDFFTRQFHPQARPVAAPDRDDIIVNACESTPFNLSHHVKARDHFWLKGQPYSVKDMLAFDPLADQFVGGTIYQAFLSALSYHRWHSPVSGKIVKQYTVDGTYYSEPLFTGIGDPHGPGGGQATGQGYICHTAARGLIFIEADNPDIGLMCVVQVGKCRKSEEAIHAFDSVTCFGHALENHSID